jgi:hypothetical protein
MPRLSENMSDMSNNIKKTGYKSMKLVKNLYCLIQISHKFISLIKLTKIIIYN